MTRSQFPQCLQLAEILARFPGCSGDVARRANEASKTRFSCAIRVVDTGSCNACDQELAAVFDPPYLLERMGIFLVAFPREADVLALTGSVTHRMAAPTMRTWASMPEHRGKVLVGECACGRSSFLGAPGIALEKLSFLEPPSSGEADFLAPLEVPGCPPPAAEIFVRLLAWMPEFQNFLKLPRTR